MSRISLVLILFVLLSCKNNQAQESNQMPIEQIIGLTQDELPAYLVLSMKDSRGKNLCVLLTNIELYWLAYSDLELEGQFLDSLKSILEVGQVPSQTVLEPIDDFIVDKNLMQELEKYTNSEIYDLFFDEKGIPLEDKKEDRIKAAVAVLIQRGTVVQQGKYSMYNVYVRP